MEKTEIIQVLTFLADVYPNFKYPKGAEDETARMVKSWYFYLHTFDFDKAIPVIKDLTMNKPQFCPTAPEIAQAVASAEPGRQEAAEESWNLILKEASYSTGRLKGALDEAARIALKRMGGVKQLGELNPNSHPFARKEFIALYTNVLTEIESENIKRIANGKEPIKDGEYEIEYKKLGHKPTSNQIGDILGDQKQIKEKGDE